MSEHKPVLQLYRDGDSFFLALPDFVDLQESPVIWLSEPVVDCMIADHASGTRRADALSIERAFFDAAGIKRRVYE